MIEKRYLRKFKKLREKFIYTTPKRKEESCEDNEEYHRQADNLLLELLKELGYNQLIKEYDEASYWFWYA